MKIDFAGIQAFVSVAEQGGFGKAANQLHVTQTALTRRVQKLEAYLGLRLLDRRSIVGMTEKMPISADIGAENPETSIAMMMISGMNR